MHDAGPERDAALPGAAEADAAAPDAGPDAGAHGGLDAEPDGGLDGGPDGGLDAGQDGGLDAGEDGGSDAGARDAARPDAGAEMDGDTARPDAGHDAGEDAAACAACSPDETCLAGECIPPCHGCRSGLACLALDELHPDTVCQVCGLRDGTFTWLPRVGAACGNGGGNACDLPDSCDGQGQCQLNHLPSNYICGRDPGPCENQDHCDGHGGCADQGFRPEGAQCGDPTESACGVPASCDAAGQCLQASCP